jgi:hypothetical protein
MPNHSASEQRLLDKIRRLPADKLKEVEDFINFLDQAETREDRDFMRAIVQGLADLDGGRSVGLVEAKKRLGLA